MVIWKRWRNCWQLFRNGQKIGGVTCVKHRHASQFFAYLKGKRIDPIGNERQRYMTDEGGWSSLWRAKRVLEMEAEIL